MSPRGGRPRPSAARRTCAGPTRTRASRTAANASNRISSSDSPFSTLCSNSAAFAQLVVGERLELGLERRDIGGGALEALDAAALADAEDLLETAVALGGHGGGTGFTIRQPSRRRSPKRLGQSGATEYSQSIRRGGWRERPRRHGAPRQGARAPEHCRASARRRLEASALRRSRKVELLAAGVGLDSITSIRRLHSPQVTAPDAGRPVRGADLARARPPAATDRHRQHHVRSRPSRRPA